MNIRILDESDARQYQELRLCALLANPEAFGSTYERESRFTVEFIIDRIKPSKDKFVLGAFDKDGALIGMVTLVRESGVKTAHKASVFGMYVTQERREQGAGKALMNELIKIARDMDGLEQVNLTVVSNNEQAKKLYQSVGFEIYGTERHALKFNDRYYDETLMALPL
ncbi:GNAT family N-acetyltransferase [Cohnella panacarvi]|uniref:GNAT family N-acetyltransferase n=1 Tax=Cohnella panacarvi TaxID=400776 RepID=UPI00047ADAAE|nr:GNAT family protein [Cohnella panacarvi]